MIGRQQLIFPRTDCSGAFCHWIFERCQRGIFIFLFAFLVQGAALKEIILLLWTSYRKCVGTRRSQPAAQTAHKSDLETSAENSPSERPRCDPLIRSHRWLWPPGAFVLRATSVPGAPCSPSSSHAHQEPGAASQEPKICPGVGRVPRDSTATALDSASPPGSATTVRGLVIRPEEGVVETAEA